MKFGKALKILERGGTVKRHFWGAKTCIYIKDGVIRIDAQAYHNSKWVPIDNDLLSDDWDVA